jgi:hypothetical protein
MLTAFPPIRFEEKDKNHTPNFRFIDTSDKCHEFIPSSDITFYGFRREMKEEWLKRMGHSEDEIKPQLDMDEPDEFRGRFNLRGGLYDPTRSVNGH